MKELRLSLIALAALSSSAFAGSTSANFQVTATISASCVVSATNIAFGAVTPAATGATTANGTLTATCTNSTPYSMSLSSGGGTIAARTMGGGAVGNTDKLAYQIYTDAAKTVIFGDGTTGQKISSAGTGLAQTSTIYGSMSNNQYIKPDSYTDSLTVTLTY